jgi:hypothetical protein
MMKWQYFLIDFCYFANWSCFANILLGDNSTFFKINFALANGALGMAVPVWRNSLVFSSFDRATSVFLHCMPPLWTYCERWFGRNDGDFATMSLTEAYTLPILAYLGWQVFYLFITEVVTRHQLDNDKTLGTSIRWLANPDKPGVLSTLVLNVCRTVGIMGPTQKFDPESAQTKLIFVMTQLTYTIITLLPIPLIYSSYWLHTVYVSVVCLIAIWNGGSYYIERLFVLSDLEKQLKAAKKDVLSIPKANGSQKKSIKA